MVSALIVLAGALLALAAIPPRPRNAPKLIVINNDGFSDFYGEVALTPEAIRESILPYRDTQVAVFEWGVLAGSRTNYPSQVSELVGAGMTDYPRRGDKTACETVRRLAAQGVDTLALVCAASREAGLPCYASIRTGDDFAPEFWGEATATMFNSDFWRSHPHSRMVNRQGRVFAKMSYAYPEVREFKLGIIRECIEHDIAGVSLDFLRGPEFVGYEAPMVRAFQERYGEDPQALSGADPRWLALKREVMTGFVRSVRELLDQAGRDRGRYLGLAARVDWREHAEVPCDDPYWREDQAHLDGDPREWCQWGLDLERWLAEGLLDYVAVGQCSLGGYMFDLRPFVEMARRSGCAVLAGEESCLSGHDTTEQEDKAAAEGRAALPEREAMTLPQYCGRARKWYAMGAAGLHLFNEWRNLEVLRTLADPAGFPPDRSA